MLTACSGDQSEIPAPEPSSTSTATQARPEAEQAARQALTTWARPDVPYEAWWADLEPLMTPEAAEDYSFTDPANIPELTIDGEAVEDPEPYDPRVTTFYYETTAGRFGVDVALDPDDQWRAFSIIFPDGQSLRQ